MSRRYGRNQKRAHRAHIAELEASGARDREIAQREQAHSIQLDHEMREWDREIERLLGPYSAFRRRTPVVTSSHPIREVAEPERLEPFYAYDGDIPISMSMSSRVRMQRHIVSIERSEAQHRRLIRFVEADRQGVHVAYSMSEELVHQAKFGPREEEYLGRRIAHELIRHANGKSKE